ncbi:MAG: hypothetical protein PHG08_03420 [Bacilli bacterium]|jgi:hypothetical protein|nr:hypothetical protein [Bacilli bacterium]HHU24688.1 hypothetical protein [Acholeplasmataceae bacterium]
MKKDKKDKKQKRKFIEKTTRADKTNEFIVRDTPTKTWWGKLILIIILVGFVLLPFIGLLFLLFN